MQLNVKEMTEKMLSLEVRDESDRAVCQLIVSLYTEYASSGELIKENLLVTTSLPEPWGRDHHVFTRVI